MKAIQVYPSDSGSQLKWADVPDPELRMGEVIIQVKATSVNRADLAQAAGMYPPPPGESDILGLEAAGVISAIGPGVTGWREGDRVFALLQGGGYAEKVCVPADLLMPVPEHWSYEQAAAVPEVWLTAHSNLFLEGRLRKGETVLIHAGASGVGTSAIQLSRESGAAVAVTAGSPEKMDRCLELGASLAICYKTEDFAGSIKASLLKSVDMILDPVGGSYLRQNISILNTGGRLINIGILGGRKGELDMGRILMKRLHIIGSRLRSRPLKERVSLTREFESRWLPLLVSGKMTAVIDRTLPITRVQEAHGVVAANENTGKVILTLP